MNARPSPRTSTDRGFTLIELLIALVLAGIIAGVTTAALITSLNVAKSTTAEVNDSTDAGLISSYLQRDALSSGATDPTTAVVDSSVGVSTDNSTTGWSGCAQTGTLVVRFSWIDRATPTVRTKIVVTYGLSVAGQLTRRICQGGTTVDLLLDRSVGTAVATCKVLTVVTTCAGRPTSVSLAVTGAVAVAPLAYTLTASMRGDTQVAPTSTNSSRVPLLALGAASKVCPNLTMSGTGIVTLLGYALVDAGCGSTPISGDQTVLRPVGSASSIVGLVDPFVGRAPPVGTCVAGGANPTTIGASATRDTVVMYHQVVNIDVATDFKPGRHIFCAGLNIRNGVTTGTDALLYVAGGNLTIAATAVVDMTARLSGSDTNLVMWVATPQTITIAGGPRVNNIAGVLYAPTSTLQISSTVAHDIGGIVVKDLTTSGTGAMRVGLPLPDIAITTSTIPAAEVSVAYTTTLVASAGTSPYTWAASGLPAGLTMGATTGKITGTPTSSSGSPFNIIVTAFDATAAAGSKDFTLTVYPRVTISAPATLPTGQVGVAYTATTVTATQGLAPYTFAAPALPAGLTINATTGVISGTPTLAGTFASVIVTATDAMAGTGPKTYSLTITAAEATCPSTFTGWKGEYYSNITLASPRTLCRDDADINFNWGTTSPGSPVPVDNFSVRWTRTSEVLGGTYKLTLGTDAGGRLFVDGVNVLDGWTAHTYPATPPSITMNLSKGPHTFVVEYYETTGAARAFFTIAPVSNGVTVTPSVGGDRMYYGEGILTIANPASITAMSVTITTAVTTGVIYNGEYSNLGGDRITEGHSTVGNVISYTFDLIAGKTVAAGSSFPLVSQYNGNGTLHPTAGDTWSVTTTSGGVTTTLTGTF